MSIDRVFTLSLNPRDVVQLGEQTETRQTEGAGLHWYYTPLHCNNNTVYSAVSTTSTVVARWYDERFHANFLLLLYLFT